MKQRCVAISSNRYQIYNDGTKEKGSTEEKKEKIHEKKPRRVILRVRFRFSVSHDTPGGEFSLLVTGKKRGKMYV